MNKKISDSDIALKLIELQMKYFDDADSFYLKAQQLKEQRLKQTLAFKLDEEPLRLFKKAHKKWEDEVLVLERELDELYQNLGAFFDENFKQ